MSGKWNVRSSWLWGLFVVDRASKWYFLSRGEYYLNKGVSFGMASSGWWVVLGAVLMVILASQWRGYRGVGLMLIGGFSNWLDRVFFGGVIDMFYGIWFWFNLADILVGVGVLVLIYEMIYGRAKI